MVTGGAFATLVRERADALHVAGDVFFTSRRVQFATAAASYRIPATYPSREAVEAGGLMAYAADRPDMYRRVGAYAGQNLQGCQARRPACFAVNQIRVRHQPANGQGSRPRSATDSARPRGRGD
jgi:ABC-type uncharacterized transport system substrate-binding protein